MTVEGSTSIQFINKYFVVQSVYPLTAVILAANM